MNKKGANMPVIILSAVLVIAVLIIVILLYNMNNPDSKSSVTNTNPKNTAPSNTPSTQVCNESWDCTDWGSCSNNAQTRTCIDLNKCQTMKNKPNEQRYCDIPAPENVTTQLIDCGSTKINIDFSEETIQREQEDNYNCFTERIEACQKTKLVYNIKFEGLLGVNQEYSHYYEIKGSQSGKCELYIRTNSYDSFSYTDSTVQSLLDSGMTQEEIDQQQQEIFEEFRQLIGRDGICKYSDTSDMKSYFDDFSSGEISGSTDEGLPNADECSGSFFEFSQSTA